jgi:hypothetical protein
MGHTKMKRKLNLHGSFEWQTREASSATWHSNPAIVELP